MSIKKVICIICCIVLLSACASADPEDNESFTSSSHLTPLPTQTLSPTPSPSSPPIANSTSVRFDLEKEFDNFTLLYTEEDTDSIDGIAAILEENYERVLSLLKVELSAKPRFAYIPTSSPSTVL